MRNLPCPQMVYWPFFRHCIPHVIEYLSITLYGMQTMSSITCGNISDVSSLFQIAEQTCGHAPSIKYISVSSLFQIAEQTCGHAPSIKHISVSSLFQIAEQTCGHAPSIKHLIKTAVVDNHPDAYYTLQ